MSKYLVIACLVVFPFFLFAQEDTTVYAIANKTIENLPIQLVAISAYQADSTRVVFAKDTLQNKLVCLEIDSNNVLKKGRKFRWRFPFEPMCYFASPDYELLSIGKKKERLVIQVQQLNIKRKQKKIRLPKEINGTISSILIAQNGDFILGGQYPQSSSNEDMQIIRVSPKGKIIWVNQFGSSIGEDGVLDIVELENGNFYYAGFTDDFNSKEYFAFLGELDNNGKNKWERSFGKLGKQTKAFRIRCNTTNTPFFLMNEDDQLFEVFLNDRKSITQKTKVPLPSLDINSKYFWSYF